MRVKKVFGLGEWRGGEKHSNLNLILVWEEMVFFLENIFVVVSTPVLYGPLRCCLVIDCVFEVRFEVESNLKSNLKLNLKYTKMAKERHPMTKKRVR